MAQTPIIDQESERQLEAEQLAELSSLLEVLERMQRVFLPQLQAAADLDQAAGRRCILAVEGLKYHKFAKFFEVSRTGVKLVEPYEQYNTIILAPLSSIILVLKQILNGEQDVFMAEKTRGKCRIIGAKGLHDGFVFNEIFNRLALVIQRYRNIRRDS